MKYKLNIPKIPFYFSIQETINGSVGPDTFLAISQVILFVISSILLMISLFYYFISWEIPDSGTKYRLLFIVFLAFFYSITHKKRHRK